MTPDIVGGRFRLGVVMGTGGTATVYAATDSAGREVAVKLLHSHLAQSPAIRDAFFEEARVAQAIQHPGIARILEWGVDEGERPRVWIAMDLVRGRTLASIVAERGALTPPDAVAMAVGLLSALAAAHRGGVVHRDVSPANVMLDPGLLDDHVEELSRSVRLLDFGLADIPGRATAGSDALLSGSGDRIGVVASVPYAAPEHLIGAPVTEASDVYQVACTIFFALTGSAPFVGRRDQVALSHVEATAPRVSEVNGGVPPSLDQWLEVALRKSPRARYSDASAMLQRLPPDIVATFGDSPQQAFDKRVDLTDDGVTKLLPAVTRTSVAVPPPAARVAPVARPRGTGWIVIAVTAAVVAGGVAVAAIAASPTSAVPPTDPAAVASPSPVVTTSVGPSPSDSAPDLRDVPDLRGLSLAEAAMMLDARGLSLGQVDRVDTASAVDVVLETMPNPGIRVAPGTAVALRVSTGNNLVPAVVGRSIQDATALLSAEGFSITVREVASTGAPGVVLACEPSTGESLPVGTVVVLTVTSPPTPTPSASSTPPPVPTSTPTSTPTPTSTGVPR